MKLLRPLPRSLSRAFSLVVILAWVAQMGWLINQSYLQAEPAALATDLEHYGSSAQWKGIYYRGEKIGFSVGQTLATDEGYTIEEDGSLQMSLLGATTAARIKTVAHVDKAFALRSFSFSLDPGTGAIAIDGALEGTRLRLEVKTATGTRNEAIDLAEPPVLALNLPRRLAAGGLVPGKRVELSVFDPATRRNAPMIVHVRAREVVRAAGRPVPAFRIETEFAGIHSTSWVTDIGEVVREESPLGLIVVKETQARATALAVPGQIQSDMLRLAAIVPVTKQRIEDTADLVRLRVRLEGPYPTGPDLQGGGQSVVGEVFEIRNTGGLAAGPADPSAGRFVGPEAFIESDAPEILEEARKATVHASDTRAMAEALVRHVNAIIEKKPTISLPSALEVLRTRVGDCNEHTALYVAMARALGIPARVAVGLVHLHGAFYYHAWPEIYLAAGPQRGEWLPVDPTLNQFPADATHVRLTRGGLDRQAAIVPIIGRLSMTILDIETKPGSTPILVGRASQDKRSMAIPLPTAQGGRRGCWSRPARF